MAGGAQSQHVSANGSARQVPADRARCRDELGEELLDPAVDLVADTTDLFDGLAGGLAGGVLELPVLIALARIDRAGIAAAHVMTTSAALTDASVSGLGNSRDRSMPSSAMAATTAGLRASAGSEPTERTTTLPLGWWSSRAAAIWLRPALCTQTNRTSGTSFTAAPLGVSGPCHPSNRIDSRRYSMTP
jgi:hypothetical protein